MKKYGLPIPLMLLFVLVFAVGCGTAAQDQTESPQPDQPSGQQSVPNQPDQPTAPPADMSQNLSRVEIEATKAAQAPPTAAPAPTEVPATVMKPEGILDVGVKETGPFFLHPSTLGNPQIFVQGTAPIGEALLERNIDGEVVGLLAESWSISDDFLTWTWKLKKGVPFNKGYGEMTSADVEWSMRQWGESKHPRAGTIANFYAEREGSYTPDDYTVVVHTGEPVVDIVGQEFHMIPAGSSTFIASKKQTEELGADAASVDIATTGPWEIVEHQTGEFWKMDAVEGHWRQTPHFAQLIFWEIPEESSRIAGFQTGQLDTFQMAFDSIPLVEEVEGAQLMSIPNATNMRLRIYGNWYPIEGVEPRPGYNTDLPWVSSNADFNSPEWERARKVREALITAVDRQGLVETILSGYGHTRIPLSGYTNALDLLEGRDLPSFDPDRARALLEEAGHGDGFSITLTPSVRGAAAEVESCEIIAQMWNDIGLDVNFQRIPYTTLRPQLVGRTYEGVTCHAGAPDPTPADGYNSYRSDNPFNRGWEHPWTEERMLEAEKAVDPVERRRLEKEVGIFLLENFATDLVYYTLDAVWPVGPEIEPWTEHVRTSDLRQINGFEFIRHKQK